MPGGWLTWRTMTERYSVSEATFRRLIELGKWPAGQQLTKRHRTFSADECDKAFNALLVAAAAGRPVDTEPAEQKARRAAAKRAAKAEAGA